MHSRSTVAVATIFLAVLRCGQDEFHALHFKKNNYALAKPEDLTLYS